jgi:hypothetical protein
MELKVGMYLVVQTKVPQGQEESPFGTCVYQITETGLTCPEIWRKKDAKGNDLPRSEWPQDGVKCVMVGGSGPSARAGYTIIDSEFVIRQNVEEGITRVVSEQEAKNLEQQLKKAAKQAQTPGMAGAVEID